MRIKSPLLISAVTMLSKPLKSLNIYTLINNITDINIMPRLTEKGIRSHNKTAVHISGMHHHSGWYIKASLKFKDNALSIARVIPHRGQDIPVKYLKAHAASVSESIIYKMISAVIKESREIVCFFIFIAYCICAFAKARFTGTAIIEAAMHLNISRGINGITASESVCIHDVPRLNFIYTVPKKYISVMPIKMEFAHVPVISAAVLFLISLEKALTKYFAVNDITGTAIKNARIYPPVGPNSLAGPPAPPENIGSPASPISI